MSAFFAPGSARSAPRCEADQSRVTGCRWISLGAAREAPTYTFRADNAGSCAIQAGI